MKKVLNGIYSKLSKYLPNKVINYNEFNYQKYVGINERVIEYEFVFKQLRSFYPKTVLDVGTGTTALPHLMRNCGFIVTASDNIRDYWSSGMVNRHYYVLDDDITKTKIIEKFDLITCISVLEHIRNSSKAIENMIKMLNPGGHLVLTCPYTERKYCQNVYDLEDSDAFGKNVGFPCQSYSRENLLLWFQEPQCKIITQEFWNLWAGYFWSQGKEIFPPKQVTVNDSHQLTCLVIEKK